MSEYGEAYRQATGRTLPARAAALDQWFDALKAGGILPPRSVQAVQAGLVAHALSDPAVDPPHFRYYNWVLTHLVTAAPGQELSAQLIGMAFVAANVFETDLPQPLTLNPWQTVQMGKWPLATQRAVVIENNGVFIWLHHLHPTWPLIDQGGNDFQPAYVTLMRQLTARGVALTYLGDLDAAGIRMADTLRQALPAAPEFLALQTKAQVFQWLSLYGKADEKRTKAQPVQDPELSQEMASVSSQGKFVEQEQLLAEYEQLIPQWLAR